MGNAHARWSRIAASYGITTAALLIGIFGLGGAAAASTRSLPSDQIARSFLKNIHRANGNPIPPSVRNGQGHARFGIFTLDSLPNFNGHFMLSGSDPFGNPNKTWYTNTVGNPPQLGGTTTLDAPVIPIGVELMNVDGQGTNLLCDSNNAAQQALASPVFQDSTYSSSSTPTQWGDALLRAEYYRSANADWHTMLAAKPEPETVVQLPPGTYAYLANPDGSCALALVDANTLFNDLFPPTATDTTTVIGAAEHSGEITPADLTNLIMGNILPCSGGFNINTNCFFGFHTFDEEPADGSSGNRQRAYVLTVSSWLDESLLGPIFADASTLTHEVNEAINDPFVGVDLVHDITPWWTDPTGSICEDVLEEGDVIEFLPNQIYPITIHGFTYHTQTEALLQWFEGETPSDAVGGALSYPDTTVLTTPMVSQNPNCAP